MTVELCLNYLGFFSPKEEKERKEIRLGIKNAISC
jgi:hypothetical protein